MAGLSSRRNRRALGSLAAACAFAVPAPAAASDVSLFTRDTVEISTIFRLTATDGQPSWVEGGLGKLGNGGEDGDFRLRPQLAEANLVWKPQLGFALSGTVVGTFLGGERAQAGISEAFLTYRPMRSEHVAFSARAGLMWPPVSLEHEGADWHVRDTATPSAINSWIGEEVRPLALEGTVAATLGGNRLTAVAAVMAANDTAGTLLTFRGWALHDRRTLAFNSHLLALDEEMQFYQAPYTHPLIDLHTGFAHRPGYYAKLAWQPRLPLRIELFRYDNRADPQVKNDEHEWGWRTQFDNLGLIADLGSGAELRAQAMSGRTRMGYPMGGSRWIDTRFRSGFVMLSRPFGEIGLAARAEAFETRNHGSLAKSEYDENGWAVTLAAKREIGPVTGVLELLHVSARRDQFEELGLDPRQEQTQIQADLRLRW